jgi:hypothetical protein
MITLNKTQLRAALNCAAKKDIRYYLQGVLLEVCTNGDVHLVGTDGHVLFCGLIAAPKVDWTNGQADQMQLIIPSDVVARECKGKGVVDLTRLADGKWLLGSSVFSPVDGRYPDWRRVAQVHAGEPAMGQFDPDLLVRCRDALCHWFNGGSKWTSYLHQFGTSSGTVTGDDMTGFCIVMPYRGNISDIKPFTPSAY